MLEMFRIGRNQIHLGEDRLATGIEVERFGKKLQLKAKKEIVLSAGAVGSPQILLLSGIGPKDQVSIL